MFGNTICHNDPRKQVTPDELRKEIVAKLPEVQVPKVSVPTEPTYYLEVPTGIPEVDAQRNVIPRSSVLWGMHHVLATIMIAVNASDEPGYRRVFPVIVEMKSLLSRIESAFDYGLIEAQKDDKTFGKGFAPAFLDGVQTKEFVKVAEPLLVFKSRMAKNTNGTKKVIAPVTFTL